MAHTAFKRLSVPIDEGTFMAIKILAKAKGASLGSTASAFLTDAAPTMVALAQAIELSKSDPNAAAKILQSMANEAQMSLSDEQLDLIKN